MKARVKERLSEEEKEGWVEDEENGGWKGNMERG